MSEEMSLKCCGDVATAPHLGRRLQQQNPALEEPCCLRYCTLILSIHGVACQCSCCSV